MDTRDNTFADLALDGRVYHGNYQGCRGAKNVAKYCTKKDDYIASFDVVAFTEAKNTKKKFCRKLIDGGKLEELV